MKGLRRGGYNERRQSQRNALWATRRLAEHALAGNLKQGAEAFQEAFAVLDECLQQLVNVDTPFTCACTLSCKKGRRLGLGCYSLILDGLAQEAGALLRPMIETIEQLTYFREDPARASQAAPGKMFSAGAIAKAIQGDFKPFRDALNEDASHFGFSDESTRHIQDFHDRTLTSFDGEATLQKNLRYLFMFLAKEAAACAAVAGIPTQQIQARIEACAATGGLVLGIQTP
jgi:hypothetical protein